jgi:putative salt-induced outer membrane protein YdiY
LRENLPAPGEPEEADAAAKSDFEEHPDEALPTALDPEGGQVVQQALPSAESQTQQATGGDLPREEATVEIAKTADGEPLESQTAAAVPGGRKFTFDDVDWIREKPTYFRYDAELNVGAQIARGNTDTTDLHFDARFEPSFGWNTLRISGLYDKKVADGDTTTNRWNASIVYERDFHRRWFVGAGNSYEADAQRDLDLRFIFGAGIGYRFYDDDPTHLSILPALAYVNENFEDDADNTDYAAIQIKTDFKRDLYKDDITFFHNNTYLNSVQELSDIIINSNTGIKFDMPWDLVLSAEFETDWENEPAEDAKKLDTRYMLKIGFEFEGDEDDWFH